MSRFLFAAVLVLGLGAGASAQAQSVAVSADLEAKARLACRAAGLNPSEVPFTYCVLTLEHFATNAGPPAPPPPPPPPRSL
jgi:hypothetical protein